MPPSESPVASASAAPSSPAAAHAETGKQPAPAKASGTSSGKAAPAPAQSDQYAGPDPCETKTFHYAAIAAACHSGGRKAAKEVMKGVVKKARVGGADLQCTSCHVDTASFHLKPNAVGDLKNWL
jgi:hypothetical protein